VGEITISLKFFGYQILAVGVIWAGMAYFYSDLYSSGRIIFYIVTSWLLLLIVLFLKEFFRGRKKD